MRRPARVLTLAVALALGGCAIGPDYERPQLPAPVEYRGVLSPQEATSFADQHWAEVFNDPELQQVIETALANNIDLKIAAYQKIVDVLVRENRQPTLISLAYLDAPFFK